MMNGKKEGKKENIKIIFQMIHLLDVEHWR